MAAKGLPQNEPLLLRATEVAARLSIGRSKVYEMMASGELPVVRFGRCVRIPSAALHRWIEERMANVSVTQFE